MCWCIYVVRCGPLIPEQAEALLHMQFLKQLLRVRNSTANDIVLEEFGRYPLQIRFWQQICAIIPEQLGCLFHAWSSGLCRFGQCAQIWRLNREDRVCEVCHSTAVEDEPHFLFDCPAYAHIQDEFPALSQILYPSVNLFINTEDFNMLGRNFRQCFLSRGQSLFNPISSLVCQARSVLASPP